jgi:hypothetical protein
MNEGYLRGGHVRSTCKLGPGKCEMCDYDSHPDLFTCEICGASEGELPTQCPGRKMSEAERDAVMRGELNFRDGEWKAETNRVEYPTKDEDTL